MSEPWEPSAEDLRQIQDALLDAFPREDQFEQMLRLGMNETLGHLAPPGALPYRVLQVMQWARAQGRLEELMIAARGANPGNPLLKQIWPLPELDAARSGSAAPAQPPSSPARWPRFVTIAAAPVALAILLTAGVMRNCGQPPDPPVVAGVVVDQQNRAVPQARVEIVGMAGRDETDSGGNFSIDLADAPAEVRLRVTMAGYEPADIRTPPRRGVVITLKKPDVSRSTAIGGNVSDVRGAPLDDVTVATDEFPQIVAKTTSSGNFRLELPAEAPSQVLLRVRKDGFREYTERVSVPVENVQVMLERRP